MPCYRSDLKPSFGGVLNEIALRTIENSYDTSIICFQHSCSVFIVFFIRLKGRLMDFEVGVERSCGCAGFTEANCVFISFLV